ncbi:MAG: DUF1080 domain-containing protein [Gammaproteobacteria bacterium]|nr:DUF1080 domain-containing protein [Pseudomonadales bacterium]
MKQLTRSFLLVTGLAAALAGPVVFSADAGWITLLEGTSGMNNFNRVGSANWAGYDGMVGATSSADGPGYLVTKESYDNFELRVEFWVSDDANSGIYMRCQDPQVITDRSCYEANIFDQRPDLSFGTGGIVHIAPVAEPYPKAGGKWNTYEITANGPQLKAVLNGVTTAEAEDSQFSSGPIALQWGRGTVRFRSVQIRPL